MRVGAVLAVLAALVAPSSALAARSTIIKVAGVDIACDLASPTATGNLFAITRDRTDGGSFAFIDLQIAPVDPTASLVAGGMDDPPLTTTGIHTTFDMVNPDTDVVIGSASVSATFTPTGSFRARYIYQNALQMGVFQDLAVAGTVTVTTAAASYAFDMASCDAEGVDRVDQIHDPSGPKPGGTAPANDLPSGALSVAPGSHIQMWTGGASMAPEVPCLVTFNGQVLEFQWGRTVWFTLQGTGGAVTIDPAGSRFDTVVAAYASGANGPDQLDCVDDLARTAQGTVTIDTKAGVMYLIQVGGVNGNLGSDSPDPQWGRLRLAVS